MNSRLGWQQFKLLLFVQGLFGLLLAAPSVASATEVCYVPTSVTEATDGSCNPLNIIDPNNVDIKDTNYPIPSGAYFVSSDGKYDNTGRTADSPWPVDKALKLAPSGSTIVFRGGTYRNINAPIYKQLTLQAYRHEKPWLKGSVVVTDWVADGDIWRKNDWTYSFPNNVSSQYIDPYYPLAGYRDMVYINGRPLRQVASKDKVVPGKIYVDSDKKSYYVPGTFFIDSDNKQLYIGDNPAGKTVEATALARAFRIVINDSADPSHTVVRGLGFAHYAEHAIRVGAPHVTLENNTFVWNGVNGVELMPQVGSTIDVSTDAVVGGNTFSYNGRHGLSGGRAHRMLLEDNTISYNNVERFAKTWDAAGVKFVTTDWLIWRRNLVEHNYSHGLWVDISSTNATIVNNISRHNQGIGIMFEISHKAIIASNLVHDNAIGIIVYNASSARLYNNTLVNNYTNLAVTDTTRNNTNTKEIAQGITWIVRGTVVKNNILSNTTGGQLFKADNCYTKEASALMIPTADYNAYYRTSSSNPEKVLKWSLNENNCGVGYNTIATFRSATGMEEHGLEINNVPMNPFFVDEAKGDYRLNSGSPAIGSGAPLPEDIASAIGLPPGVAVDLGASNAVLTP
jgi:parallel beta-helix repeat protein